MGNTIQVAFCKTCKKEITEPLVRQLDTMEKSVWVILILATLGIGIIPFIFYYLYKKKKNYCPKCGSKLQILTKKVEEPKKISKPTTPKEKVLEKAQKVKPDMQIEEKPEEKVFCQYCGEEISKNPIKCPYCKSVLK